MLIQAFYLFITSTFGTGHGMFLVIPAGKRWREEYKYNGVCALEEHAADLNTTWMCSYFGAPISDKSTIHKRTTVTTPSVKYTLSTWTSYQKVRRIFVNSFLPNFPNAVFQRLHPFSRYKTSTKVLTK